MKTKCPRCGDQRGVINKFKHHLGGKCFLCHGRGHVYSDDGKNFYGKQKDPRKKGLTFSISRNAPGQEKNKTEVRVYKGW